MTVRDTAADHYEVLGIARDASPLEVNAAYRRGLARLQHGLNTGTAPGPEVLDALSRAYRTLSDPAARDAYDATYPPAFRAGVEHRPDGGGDREGHAVRSVPPGGGTPATPPS